mgnify:CR=1 FL=1
MDVKVLGWGCQNCLNPAEIITAKAAELGVAVTVEKVTDFAAIASYGVMRTPGVVIDGKVVHAGGVPSADDVAGWLTGV